MDAVLAALGARVACLLSAWNPGSRLLPEGRNARRQAALAARLRRFASLPASGAWRGWREAHVLAALPPARALHLARLFGQAAILVLAQGRPARLALV
jgi:hypothetical protein